MLLRRTRDGAPDLSASSAVGEGSDTPEFSDLSVSVFSVDPLPLLLSCLPILLKGQCIGLRSGPFFPGCRGSRSKSTVQGIALLKHIIAHGIFMYSYC